MKHYLYCAGILLSSAITSVQAADIQGLWKVYDSFGAQIADWVIGVNNNTIYGSSYWYDVNNKWMDRLDGTTNSNTVSITRYLSGSYTGKTQLFTGTISGANISGTWSGTGCINSPCTWTAAITPLATSTTNCPTIPSCPTVTTTSNATFNFNTGRLIIPNLAVSMSAPFGGAEQIFNYGIEMQQRTGAFVFDLDLSKVVQR